MMHPLEHLIEQSMPMNRDERFWSATVLPALVAGTDLSRLSEFLDAIEHAVGANRAPRSARDVTKFLFFTEYDLQKSNGSDRFGPHLQTKYEVRSTPDLVVLDATTPRSLYAIEVKMFDAVNWLREQMDKQRTGVLAALSNDLSVSSSHIYHIALVPDAWRVAAEKQGVSCMTWRQVLDLSRDLRGTYFHECLVIAMNHFDRLASSHGRKAERWMAGQQILAYMEAESPQTPSWVGVGGGLSGKRIRNLRETGRWKATRFQTNWSADAPPNRNWMSVKDFAGFFRGG